MDLEETESRNDCVVLYALSNKNLVQQVSNIFIGNVPFKQRACAAAQCLSHSRARVCLPQSFIGLACSQFELIKIKFRIENYTFLLFLGAYKLNVCCGTFSKIAASPLPRLPKPTQLPLRRHHGLRTCIPSIEGTLFISNCG
jgi:hypothetical protein